MCWQWSERFVAKQLSGPFFLVGWVVGFYVGWGMGRCVQWPSNFFDIPHNLTRRDTILHFDFLREGLRELLRYRFFSRRPSHEKTISIFGARDLRAKNRYHFLERETFARNLHNPPKTIWNQHTLCIIPPKNDLEQTHNVC